ncbi:MAG: hypothetical protein V8S96_07380 [Lachnospiraceae bacterium]
MAWNGYDRRKDAGDKTYAASDDILKTMETAILDNLVAVGCEQQDCSD